MATRDQIITYIYELKDKVSGKLREIVGATREQGNVADKTADQVQRSNDKIGKSYDGVGASVGKLRGILGALGVAFSLNTIKDGIVSILGVGDAAERTKIQLAQLYGTQAAGNKAYDELRALAKETGQSFQGVLEAATKLKAQGLEPLDGTLKALINQTAALGGEQETLTGIGQALGQMYAKQKIQTEEILQLVERGVPAFDLLAKVTGKQGEELQKLIQSGSLGRETIRGLITEIGKASDGAAAKSLNTLSGLVTQLRDQFSAFLERIANSGAADFFKAKLKGIRDEIELMVNDGRLQKFAEDTSNSITKIGEVVSAVTSKWRALVGASDAFTSSVASIFKANAVFFTEITATVTRAFNKLTGAGEETAKKFERLDQAAKGSLADSLKKTRDGAVAVGEGFGFAGDKGDKLVGTFANVKAGAESTASVWANVEAGVKSTAPAFDELAAAAKAAADEIAKAQDELSAAAARVEEARKAMAELAKANSQNKEAWEASNAALRDAVVQYEAAKKKVADLTGETAKAEAQTKALGEAFKTLKVTSQSELDAAAAAAEKAFETIVQASYRGQASAQDVQRAFAAYAAAERARVADGDARAQREVEQHIRIAASAAGLGAEYDRLAEAGKNAGDQAAKGFEAAKEKIDAAADSAAKLGSAADSAASDLDSISTSATSVTVAVQDAGVGLGFMTDRAREALAAAQGFDGIGIVLQKYRDEIFSTREELDAFTRSQQAAEAAAASAADELAKLTEKLKEQRDAATLSEAELEQKRFQQELAHIEELANAAGVNARAQAAELRGLAEAEHRRKLAEIAEEARAQREANSQASGGSGSGSTRPTPTPTPNPRPNNNGPARATGPATYSITINVSGTTADVVREVKKQLDEIARRNR